MVGHGSDNPTPWHELTATLPNEGARADGRGQLHAQILKSSGMSSRTLRRYVQHCEERGCKNLVGATCKIVAARAR